MGGRIFAVVRSQEKHGNLLGWCLLICRVFPLGFSRSVVRKANKGGIFKIILSIKRQRLQHLLYPDTRRAAPQPG